MNERSPSSRAGAVPPDDLLAQLRAHAPPASRYDRRGEIARGGMGSILEVWDADLGRTSAMKVIRDDGTGSSAEADGRLLSRFLDEARVTGQLEHPGIVPVHELGLGPDGQVYFTMPLVKGRTLGEVLALVDEGSEEWSRVRVLHVILRACEALAYAHSRGVVHRDVKPDNIMVGAFGEVYVMDWGLAKVLGGSEPAAAAAPEPAAERASIEGGSSYHTMHGDIVGTPSYMPPEQARGELDRIGPTADVYAVGAILYQLLAGHAPYGEPGGSSVPSEVLMELLEQPPAPLGEMDRSIPAGLIGICERAMQRDPGERYRDLGEMAAAIRGHLEQGVAQARTALGSSRLLRGLSLLSGCLWWLMIAVTVLLVVILVVPAEEGRVSFDLTVPLDLEEESYEIVPRAENVDGAVLSDVRGKLRVQATHWTFRMGAVLPGVVGLGVLLMIVGAVRRILATLRTGSPFSVENVRRLRRLGFACSGLALASSLYHSLTPLLAARLVAFDRLDVQVTPQVSFTPLGAGLLLLVLAEVFRVGAELENQRAG